jgi:methylated-DNA-[protein]-cysteine S-methyltransferase
VIFKTPFGWMAVVSSEKGLEKIFLPVKNLGILKKNLSQVQISAAGSDTLLGKTKAWFIKYFNGISVPSFSPPLALDKFTHFQKQVFSHLQKIPYGEVRSYQWLAERVSTPQAARAVGNALRKNPFPVLLPCHRVIRKEGTLGNFSYGMEWKRRLLRLERIHF